MPKRFLWIMCSIVLGGTPAMLRADDATSQYHAGVAFFKEQKFIEAAEAFRTAYSLRPSWKLYYNIAQCEAAAKRYGVAIEAFEAYLVGGGDDIDQERTEYVISEIRRLQTLVGRLEIVSPDGIEVFIDGKRRRTTPLEGPLRVAVGKHQLLLTRGDSTVLEKQIQIAGGIATKVILPESPQPAEAQSSPVAPPVAVPVSSPRPEKKKSLLRPLSLATISAATAILVGGTITGSLALSKSNELKESCPERVYCSEGDRALKERSHALAISTNVLLPLGGVLAVAGGLLFFFDQRARPREQARALEVQPVAGAQWIGLTMAGRF